MFVDSKDKLFCEVAVDLGLLNNDQVQEFLEKQRVDIAIGEKKPIGTYLFEAKILNKEQIAQILKIQDKYESAAPTSFVDNSTTATGTDVDGSAKASGSIKNGLILVLSLLILAYFFGGPDPVQEDLLDYLNNHLPKVAALEGEMNDSYNSVMGDNFKSAALTVETLRTKTIPAGRKLLDLLDKISPKTQEVQNVHAKLVEIEHTAFDAYALALVAGEKQDPELIIKSNEKLTEIRKLSKNSAMK